MHCLSQEVHWTKVSMNTQEEIGDSETLAPEELHVNEFLARP
jgi:hypothetical protein